MFSLEFDDEEILIIFDYFRLTLEISKNREIKDEGYFLIEEDPPEWYGKDPELARQFQNIVRKFRPCANVVKKFTLNKKTEPIKLEKTSDVDSCENSITLKKTCEIDGDEDV